MYVLRTKSEFDSAHFLKDYDGRCANIHGHRWRVTVEVGAEEVLSEGPYRGMVVDFGKLKVLAVFHWQIFFSIGEHRQNFFRWDIRQLFLQVVKR